MIDKDKCGQFLDRLPHDLPDHYHFACACCARVWELRPRSRWTGLAFWRRTVPARDGSRVWVRLSAATSLLVMAVGERD